MALALALAASPAGADPGVRLGSRGGVELRDATDPYLGLDLRLAFPLSPLTLNPTFDYVFDQKRTLYEISLNALYYVPIPIQRIDPYLGVGANFTSFSFKQETTDVDGNGNRLGLNLIAGTCFDLPVVAPFVQVEKAISELDFVSFSAGVLVALDGDSRWTGCGRRAP
jgi:hypothetical protein